MSLDRKISTDILIVGILKTTARFRSVILLTVITSGLGVAEYGAYIQLLGIVIILGTISSFNLNRSFVNFAQDSNVSETRLYYFTLLVVFILSTSTAILIFLNSFQISKLALGTTQYQGIFRIGAAWVPTMVLSNLAQGYFRSQMKVRWAEILQVSREYIRVIVAVVVIFLFQESLQTLVNIIVSIEILIMVVFQSYIIFNLGFESPSVQKATTIFEYSSWLTLSTVANQLASRADRLLIGYYIGAGAVGTFSIAYGLASLLFALVAPIRSSFFPEFSRLISEGELEDVRRYTSTAIFGFSFLAIPGTVGLIFVSESLLLHFVSSTEASQSAQLVPIISAGIAFYGLETLQSTSLLAAKKSKPIALIRSGSAIVNIILNIIFIPIFGLIAAAAATTLTYAISAASVYILLYKLFSFTFPLKRFKSIILASVGMGCSLFYLPTINIIVDILVGIIIYIILFIILYDDSGKILEFIRKYM